MSPYPCAFTSLKVGDRNKGLKFFEEILRFHHQNEAGTLEIAKNVFKIYTKDGFYSQQKFS